MIRVVSNGYILLRDTRPTIKVQVTDNNIKIYNVENWPRLRAPESYILEVETLQAMPVVAIHLFPLFGVSR